MKEANDKKESMKPVSQAAVELDDEALDQVSGGLKRLDSELEAGTNRGLQVMRLHQKRPWWFMPGMQKQMLTAKERIKIKRYYAFTRKNKDRRSKAGCK